MNLRVNGNMIFLQLLIVSVKGMILDSPQTLKNTIGSFKQFESQVQVQETPYSMACSCENQPKSSQCNPSKIKLSQDKDGSGSDYTSVTKLLSSYNFEYSRVKDSYFGCLDGRVRQEVLGTPGGDAGEFILALLVYEDLSGKKLDQESVDLYFTEWLKCMSSGVFYMCTDDQALNHMQKELGIQGLDIINPRPSLIPALIEKVSQPTNIGDSHLKLMLEQPELYSIVPTTVEYFVKSFYKVLWDQTNPYRNLLYLDILPGFHYETAFLEVRNNQICEGLAPAIAPWSSSYSILVNHLDAVTDRRKQLSSFFAVKIAKNNDGITENKLLNRMNHHGMLFLDVTGSRIAKELPFYTALFV